MDTLPHFPQAPLQIGTDIQALDNVTYPPLFLARMTEVLHHSVKIVLHSPALEPINKKKWEEYQHSTTNDQVHLNGTPYGMYMKGTLFEYWLGLAVFVWPLLYTIISWSSTLSIWWEQFLFVDSSVNTWKTCHTQEISQDWEIYLQAFNKA
jgi:hypothetical protein